MKTRILSIFALASLFFGAIACQTPEDLKPSVSRDGINSFTAKFDNDDRDENVFHGIIDHENLTITVVFPYTYPARSKSHLTLENLTHVRVSANLDDNVILETPLLYMDLTVENEVVLIDQVKNRKVYTVTGEIRKSNECFITEYKVLMDDGATITGIVNDTESSISILYGDDPIGSRLASYEASFDASISPDPAVEPQNYDSQFSITVTAQDGKTKKTYTIEKKMAGKKEKGMRANSEKEVWKKKLKDDVGITVDNLTGGMAVTKEHVILNTRGEDLVVLSRKTGANVGTIALPFKGSTTNFYCTADDDDNILVCNLTPNSGNTFTIYRIKGIDGTPTPYITYDGGGMSLGRKISVRGSLEGNAIITAPVYVGGAKFLRWQVVGGALVSETPDVVTIETTALGEWNYNCDVVYLDPSDTSSDFFVASYSEVTWTGITGTNTRAHLWCDGKTNTIKYVSQGYSANWVPNAVDVVNFNGVDYFVANTVNGFTWGSDDLVYLYDLSANDLSTVLWKCDQHVFGSFATSGIANGNYTGDVAIRLSPDGYYMYVYFMFTNGYVVCEQFDCVDM